MRHSLLDQSQELHKSTLITDVVRTSNRGSTESHGHRYGKASSIAMPRKNKELNTNGLPCLQGDSPNPQQIAKWLQHLRLWAGTAGYRKILFGPPRDGEAPDSDEDAAPDQEALGLPRGRGESGDIAVA